MQEASTFVGFPIRDLLNKKHTAGTVGLEIEMEGKNFPKTEMPKGWQYHEDHSLRGEDNAEYVLSKPIPFEAVDDMLSILWKQLQKYDARVDLSNRTSVHVHLNVQTWYMDRLASFVALYMTFEELLTQWCGDHRVGNLFCLRTKDAPAILSAMKTFIKTNGSMKFSNGMHYAGLNISALDKFGSIEIRSMRGALTPDEVSQWVQMLRRLYDVSESYSDPRSVVDAFSSNGPLGFLEEIFGPTYNTLIKGVEWSYEKIKDSLYEGIRLAQELAFCVDWDDFQKIEIRPDPFNRSTINMVQKLKHQAQLSAAAPSPAIPTVQQYEPEPFFEDDEEDYEPEPEYDGDYTDDF